MNKNKKDMNILIKYFKLLSRKNIYYLIYELKFLN